MPALPLPDVAIPGAIPGAAAGPARRGTAAGVPPRQVLRIAAAVATVLSLLALALDRLPRFYQGDSLAYLTTGLNGWIPPDRSWAYGYATRWLVEGTGSAAALAAVQTLLMLGAVLLSCRAFLEGKGTRWAILAFAVIASLDPLNQAYTRFWLSDTPAAAAYVAIIAVLAAGVAAPAGRFRRVLLPLAALTVFAVFVRVAYAPILAATLVIAAAAACLQPAHARPPRLRRRMLALIALPAAAVGALAVANSQVAVPSLRGQVFVNRMSDLYTLGVFLPALRYEDFVDAGVPITRAEFDGLDRSLDARESQVWVDGPGHVRWLMMQRLGVDQVYDRRFQAACASVVRTALLRHPQDFAATYLRSLAITFDPAHWRAVMRGELGFELPLPDWTAAYLSGITGRTVLPAITAQPSLLPDALLSVAGAYPALLLAGGAAAALVLAFARPFGSRHVLASAILACLLVTPLFSHALKPRYLLAPVLLSELLLALLLIGPAALRTARALVRSPVLPAAAALLCIAAYTAQLGLGRWQTDEFTLFANQRDGGWQVLVPRLAYSPRPFSEGVLFLYGLAVNGLGRPLIVPFLGLLWAGVAGTVTLAAWAALPRSPWRLLSATALAGTLFAFVLVTNEVTEAFYWPMGAAAYLPVAGSAAALLFLLSRPLDARRRAGCCAALLVAAGSSEMGAALAAGFAAAAVEAATRPGGARLGGTRISAVLRDGLWWLLPGLLGGCALGTIVLLRANVVELGADTQPYTGRLLASLGMTLRQLALDLTGFSGAAAPAAILGALAAKLAFAAGFAGLWRLADRGGAVPGRLQAVLAAALAGAAGFSVLAAYYHYGTLCCERQGTTRHWLLDLLLVLAACWALARWPAPGRVLDQRPWLAPALLALSLMPILGRAGGLLQGYGTQHLTLDGAAKTWRSGRQAGTDQMEFYLPPDGDRMLVRGTAQPIGMFRTGAGAGTEAPEMVRELGRYFGKQVVFTCQPWQNEKSWLLNGQFIPACPPHDGPPDIVYPPP